MAEKRNNNAVVAPTPRKVLADTNPPKLENQYKVFIIKLCILSIFILFLMFLNDIRNILYVLIFSLFLNMLFSPLLNRFNKWKIPDIVWIIIIYLLILVFILLALFAIIPIFVKQFIYLTTSIEIWFNWIVTSYSATWIDWLSIPNFAKEALKWLDLITVLQTIQTNAWEITKFVWDKAQTILSSGFWLISTITSSIANVVLVAIFTFFIALERVNIRKFFYHMIPDNWWKYFLSKEPMIIKSIKNWFTTQWLLGLCIFMMTLIGLSFLSFFWFGLEGRFTLALIAWMMEFVPYVGPIFSAIPAIAIALWISFKASVAILILYIIIQQVENNILVPYIMWKSLSLSPFAVLIWMTVWATLFWIIWIIIAVPVVAVVQIFVKDYIDRKNKK